ncbi:hypothetical protein PIB30_052909 [Stylosanthes scabra]|uniref:Transposase n=1 Tax=Stylosanthes scabra TaxID=79078 RepID=A0ABU6UHS5_9FABA|nr:hypothetical protein [Stylosanthes scabra]
MSRRFSQIVVRVYPNGVPRERPDAVEFHSSDLVVFLMWLVETLSDLQKTVLRNMRLPEHTPMILMAYRFLAVLHDRSCPYRVSWLTNDEHVRAMFASHGRILADQVMDLYVHILDTRIATPGEGPYYPKPEVQTPMTVDPVDVEPPHVHTGETEFDGEDLGDSDGGSSGSGDDEFVGNTSIGTRFLLPALLPVPDLSTVDSHFHTLDLDAMEEDQLIDIGGGSDDYNLDGGRVTSWAQGLLSGGGSHGREELHHPEGCRVQGVGIQQEVRKFAGPHACLAPRMSTDNTVIAGYIMHIIKRNWSIELRF